MKGSDIFCSSTEITIYHVQLWEQQDEKKIAKERGFQLVLFSPEAVVSIHTWRTVVQSKEYQEKFMSAWALTSQIDEAHCVRYTYKQ